MNNKLKQQLKRTPYLKVAVNKAREFRINCTERVKYINFLLNRKPYFGSIKTVGHHGNATASFMGDFIRQIAKDNFIMMELGTWAGHSACIWGEELKKYKNCKVVCIDSYSIYESLNDKTHDKLREHIKSGQVINYLTKNIELCGLKDIVYLFKTSHEKASEFFKNEFLDYLYIDLGITYEEQMDIFKRYYPLVKKGGWIGGDDYDDGHAYRKKAVNDFLGPVESKECFWFKQKL